MITSQPWNFLNDEIFMPITWSEESFEMPESITDDFKTSVYNPMNTVNTCTFWLIICSSTVLICSLVAAFLKNYLQKRYKIEADNEDDVGEYIRLEDGESQIEIESENENAIQVGINQNQEGEGTEEKSTEA